MMFTMKCVFFLGFLVFLRADFIQSDRVSSRIINGRNAKRGEFPFQASLQKDDQHFCGGAIINKNYVITAAHCVENDILYPYLIKVVVGTLKWNKPESIHNVWKIIMHDFNRKTSENDIALLKVKNPFIFSKLIKYVLLPQPHQILHENQMVVVSGWGETDLNYGKSLDTLQRVNLVVANHNSCRNAYASMSKVFRITKNQFCAHSPNEVKGICGGDSGGPLTVNGILFGIVSWGGKYGCANPAYPDVFTKVSKYVEWIINAAV